MDDFAESCVGQRVLVTGGCGFVGRAVVRALRTAGAAVIVVDQQPFSGDDHLITSVVGDLTDPATRERAVSQELTGIVHLAAITSVLRSAELPQQTFITNVEVTQGLLELARLRGIERFVLASTNAVVGNVGMNTISENNPLRPLTPYGATKAACEMLLSGYAGAYGLACCALRFTNIYGPGMESKDSFVPRLMRAALAGSGVQVYGDGSQRRDLVHINDVVQGIMRAILHRPTGTMIIGSGQSISVNELIATARKVTGALLPIENIPAKNGEMPAVIVDISHARDELGYQPTMSLHAGLATVWEDFTAAAVNTGSVTRS